MPSNFEYHEILLVMLTYNHEDTIVETLDSLIAQNLHSYNLLIVDDCSSDSTYQILIEYERRESRIKVFRNDINIGVEQNFRQSALLALNLAPKASYFSFVSPDDIYLPNWLEKLYSKISSNPKVAVVQSNIEYSHNGENWIAELDDIKVVDNILRRAILCHSRNNMYFHGLWSKNTFETFSQYPEGKFEELFRLENFLIALLSTSGDCLHIPEVMLLKKVDKGSRYRYPEHKWFKSVEYSNMELVRIITRTLILMLQRSKDKKILITTLLLYLWFRLQKVLYEKSLNLKKS